MSNSIRQKYRAEILDLTLCHSARNVLFFGYLARSEGREDSDIDLLVTRGKGCSVTKLSFTYYEQGRHVL
jgi:predicted nucleotidyltransferase